MGRWLHVSTLISGTAALVIGGCSAVPAENCRPAPSGRAAVYSPVAKVVQVVASYASERGWIVEEAQPSLGVVEAVSVARDGRRHRWSFYVSDGVLRLWHSLEWATGEGTWKRQTLSVEPDYPIELVHLRAIVESLEGSEAATVVAVR